MHLNKEWSYSSNVAAQRIEKFALTIKLELDIVVKLEVNFKIENEKNILSKKISTIDDLLVLFAP